MEAPLQTSSMTHRLYAGYVRAVRALVLALAGVAGTGIVVMMAVTCVDVALRAALSIEPLREALYHVDAVQRVARWLLAGEVDLVEIAGAIVIACALPYTTAAKGHVAIEYFFDKLSPRGRRLVDTPLRLLVMALFAVLAWQSVRYGLALAACGEVTPTLQIPVYWIPYVIAVCLGVSVLVILHGLLHPGREMAAP